MQFRPFLQFWLLNFWEFFDIFNCEIFPKIEIQSLENWWNVRFWLSVSDIRSNGFHVKKIVAGKLLNFHTFLTKIPWKQRLYYRVDFTNFSRQLSISRNFVKHFVILCMTKICKKWRKKYSVKIWPLMTLFKPLGLPLGPPINSAGRNLGIYFPKIKLRKSLLGKTYILAKIGRKSSTNSKLWKKPSVRFESEENTVWNFKIYFSSNRFCVSKTLKNVRVSKTMNFCHFSIPRFSKNDRWNMYHNVEIYIRIFLSLYFYVKSICGVLEMPNLHWNSPN